MSRHLLACFIACALCVTVSIAYAAPRGKSGGRSEGERGGERSGGERGGERSGEERSGGERREGASGKPEGERRTGEPQRKPEDNVNRKDSGEGRGAENRAAGEGERRGGSPGGAWSQRTHQSGQGGVEHKGAAAAGDRNRNAQPSGAQGAAAGAAAANRRGPQANGAQGAAAGAAAANRRGPQASGAEGAAAGAAAANRNNPKYSGAQGAAAGAAAANRNQPAASGAAGVAAGAAAANRNQPGVSGAAGAAAGSAAVRNSFDNHGLYNDRWYGDHAGAWNAGRWATGGAWTAAPLAAVGAYYGAAAAPVYYNYGTSPNYQNGQIMMGDQNLGTPQQFSQQAADLASAGAAAQPDDGDEWMPLGVFAMVRNEQQHPQLILQMAVNKQGILRGNYTDEVSDTTLPIAGSVDPKTQRAAWTVGDNKNSVMEAGMSNLASGEAPALIHKNGKTDHWLLVRLDQPAAKDAAAAQ